MTVYAPTDKISWKVSVPVNSVLIAVIIVIWLILPVPIYAKCLGTLSLLILIFMSLIWTLWGDYEEGAKADE